MLVTSTDSPPETYRARLIDQVLPDLLRSLPAISLVGPRGAGKTTTALHYAASTRRLNRPAEAGAFQADPYAVLATLAEPVLLDEWQEVPEVLGAVKEAVDQDPRPGRFLLTGSVRIAYEKTWPATGRVVRCPVYPLTQREINQRTGSPPLIERLRRPSADALAPAAGNLTLVDYLDLAQAGGLPDAVFNRSGRARDLWLRSYLAELTASDIRLTGANPDRRRFSAYLRAVAASSGTVVDDLTLLDAAHVSRPTAAAYDELLEAVYFAERLPAWWSDRLTRLTARPKRLLLDTSLMLASLNLDRDGVLADAAMLGRVLETFVAMQVRAEVAVVDGTPTLSHLREKAGRREIDFIVEYADSTVAALEVKATASPDRGDARHLIWLRDQLGDRLVAGVVFHTGPYTLALSDRVWAAPISTFWA